MSTPARNQIHLICCNQKTLQFYDELAFYIAAGGPSWQSRTRQPFPPKQAQVDARPRRFQVMDLPQEIADIRAAGGRSGAPCA